MNTAAARRLTTAYRLHRLARTIAPTVLVARIVNTTAVTTAADYLATKNLTDDQMLSIRGTFGKRAKALYVAIIGRDPHTIPGIVLPTGRATKVRNIDVAAYPARFAAVLFDLVWDAHFAH